MEFNNLKLGDLSFLLTEETTLERYYFLIPEKEKIISALVGAGIVDGAGFLSACGDLAALGERTGLELSALKGIRNLLNFYRFRPRPMRDFRGESGSFAQALLQNGVKDSGGYLAQYLALGPDKTAEQYGATAELAHRFACLCDLMRLPGVKLVRATVFYDSGYPTVKALAHGDVEGIQRDTAQSIGRMGGNMAVPTKKEPRSLTALAKALSDEVDLPMTVE